MSVPPFEIIDFYDENTLVEKKSVYFLSEGKNSEKFFLRSLINQTPFGLHLKNNYILKEINKTGKESGLSNPIALVKYALEWTNDQNNSFDKTNSKIVVFFDCDVLSDEDIRTLESLKCDYIVYAFSNPKFEVVQLLSVLDDLSELEEQYNDSEKPNNILENEFSRISHINSKNTRSGKFVATRIDKILNKNKYSEKDLLKAKNKFCTNIIDVLTALVKGDCF